MKSLFLFFIIFLVGCSSTTTIMDSAPPTTLSNYEVPQKDVYLEIINNQIIPSECSVIPNSTVLLTNMMNKTVRIDEPLYKELEPGQTEIITVTSKTQIEIDGLILGTIKLE